MPPVKLTKAQSEALRELLKRIAVDGPSARCPYGPGSGAEITRSTASVLKRLGLVTLYSEPSRRPARAGFGREANWKTVVTPNLWMEATPELLRRREAAKARRAAQKPPETSENPAPMEVQSVLFDKQHHWSPMRAETWLREHDYHGLDMDNKPNTLRYRQADPELFQPQTFRTIPFGEDTGIQAIVGKQRTVPNPNPRRAPGFAPGSESEFIALFKHKDALIASRERVNRAAIEEVAWELGYEGEPYADIARFEGLAQQHGADLRGAHARGAAERPRENPKQAGGAVLSPAQVRALTPLAEASGRACGLGQIMDSRTRAGLLNAGLIRFHSSTGMLDPRALRSKNAARRDRSSACYEMTEEGWSAYRAATSAVRPRLVPAGRNGDVSLYHDTQTGLTYAVEFFPDDSSQGRGWWGWYWNDSEGAGTFHSRCQDTYGRKKDALTALRGWLAEGGDPRHG